MCAGFDPVFEGKKDVCSGNLSYQFAIFIVIDNWKAFAFVMVKAFQRLAQRAGGRDDGFTWTNPF